MGIHTENTHRSNRSNRSNIANRSSGLFRKLLPVCILIVGLAAGFFLYSRQSEIKRKPVAKQAVAVETMPLTRGDYQGSIYVMGTVVPDKEVLIKSRVAGEVVSILPEFVLGGQVKKGQRLISIDDSDYKIEVEKAQSALEKAVSDLAIEQGSQLIAQEELKLINEVSSEEVLATDLALRKPQLLQAKAAVRSARADLEKAKLNVSRTQIYAPFNALVLEKSVEKGSLVSAQGTICTLVDIDFFQVEAQVAPDRLPAFMVDEKKGSQAFVHSRYSQQTWEGTVVRTTGKMTAKSRMAGVIIRVPDPIGLKQNRQGGRLLLEDHVDVRILGKVFENVYVLPRDLLRENQTVWVYNNGKLDIRPVEIAWTEDGQVFVSSGIQPLEQLITSDLPAPVNGMAVQTAADRKKAAQAKSAAKMKKENDSGPSS